MDHRDDHPPSPELRGIFGQAGDSPDWLDAVSRFPNGVPRFPSKREAQDFARAYLEKKHGRGSNPDHPHLQHIFTTLIGWEQIERYLLPALNQARGEPSGASQVPTSSTDGEETPPPAGDNTNHSSAANNIYETAETQSVREAIAQRLDVPFHRCTTVVSTMNTLSYLYHHMKYGIFVMIRNRQLRIFAPFVNDRYRNTWSQQLRIDCDDDLDKYYGHKSGRGRPEAILPDRSQWWANGNIICNELARPGQEGNLQHWGDHFLCPLRDMLAEACRLRNLPDCEFFLNKRDYPQLKVNVSARGGAVPVEPYGFIYGKDDRDETQDVDLVEEHKFKTYAPIVSFYAAAPDRFTDIPFPSSEDWEGACGLVFPKTFQHKRKEGKIEMEDEPRDLFTEENFRKFERSWEDGRVATAFFRGTATGGGTTVDNNQRLKVAALSHEWKYDPVKGGKEPYLDAAIVGWNLRDKKIAEGPMTFLRSEDFAFTADREEHFTPIYKQSKYKYLVYVDGHCAACRYGFMLRLGSVILKVASRQVADRMWYFPLLKPYHDHVPVKEDLSDLEEKIHWCREHDDECRQIAENAKKFYEKYVARKALLDYIEMVCKNVAKRFVEPPLWWTPPPRRESPPKLCEPGVPCHVDRQSGQSRLCRRCQESHDAEVKKRKDEEDAIADAKVDSMTRKRRLAERRRGQAEANKKQKKS